MKVEFRLWDDSKERWEDIPVTFSLDFVFSSDHEHRISILNECYELANRIRTSTHKKVRFNWEGSYQGYYSYD